MLGPDLSVKQSNVAGWERGNLTVQCLYSTAYRNEQKKWCRFKDGSCTTATLKSPVKVIDDQKTTFSLQMSELKKSDAGWYCCIAGDLQASFNVSVGDPPGIITHMWKKGRGGQYIWAPKKGNL